MRSPIITFSFVAAAVVGPTFVTAAPISPGGPGADLLAHAPAVPGAPTTPQAPSTPQTPSTHRTQPGTPAMNPIARRQLDLPSTLQTIGSEDDADDKEKGGPEVPEQIPQERKETNFREGRGKPGQSDVGSDENKY